uniref:Uncharacterized protein n=1 Tax=Oryza rufipogon TaxID=4529 RepID=A0A0E0PK40_ORYRU
MSQTWRRRARLLLSQHRRLPSVFTPQQGTKAESSISSSSPSSPSSATGKDALPFVVEVLPFDLTLSHAADHWERHHAHGSSKARPERRHHDLVAVPAAVARIRPSRRANIFPSRSSPNALKNPQDLSTEERDRAILLQVQPLSSIIDSSFSVSQADTVHARRSVVAEPFRTPSSTTKLR